MYCVGTEAKAESETYMNCVVLGPQNNANYSPANQRGKRGYAAPAGSAWRGSKRSLSPEQNTRDRRRIKLDLEDFLADNFGLRPSNPLTLEQFVAELKKEK